MERSNEEFVTHPDDDPWRLNEIVRRRRLREHGRRSPDVNLAEGLVWIESLAAFRGAARRTDD